MVSILLIDQPEEGYCEERGWVSCNSPMDEARLLLQTYCCDEDGRCPARPIGEPRRVWLRSSNPEVDFDEQRWDPCEAEDGGAVEFWEFDATDTEPVVLR